MTLKLRASICALAILAGGSAAYAAIATGTATAIIQNSAGILVTKDLTFQAQIPSGTIAGAAAAAVNNATNSTTGAVSTGATGSLATVTSGGTTSGATGGAASDAALVPQGGSPAALTVTGAPGDTVSLAVPQTFNVTAAGGTGVLTVTTLGVGNNSVLGGSLRGNGSLSVDVGGRIALAGQVATPGDYSGVLLVIGQYN